MASVLFAFAGLGFGVYGFLASGRVRAAAPSANASATADALQAAFVSVAERVRPAVVNIGTVQVASGRRPQSRSRAFGTDDPFFKDFFDQFFGTRRDPAAARSSVDPASAPGSIIDKRGFVLTNYHVILGADSVTVKPVVRRRVSGAGSVGVDSKTDLAVVQFEPDRRARRSRSSGTPTHSGSGEWAIAIGNPFGLDQTVHRRRRQRHRPRRGRAGDLRELHPDRCVDQPGQLRRAARESARRGHRHQHRDPRRPARASASRSRPTWRAG